MQNPYGGGPPPGPAKGQHGTEVMAQYPVAPPPAGAPPPPVAAPPPEIGTQPLPPPSSYAQPAAAPYMQPQQPPVANGQWGPQGQPMQRLVGGVALEPGEKVLYYYRANRIGYVIFGLIIGIIMIPAFGLGLYLLYLTITDRSHSTYVQTITNKRLMAINGHGKPLWQIRWDEVRGLNKVTGRRYEFGVRNANGQKFMFDDNVHIVEMVITKLAGEPMLREQSPEVAFDPYVN
ncbi:MAG: hypothetical protein KIT84_31425 [Labilithrix sp.]|nr:hypothetical protein [Labilithrix sp.]MCW5815581.1 hypothetical protein [Labilithrix sp.]